MDYRINLLQTLPRTSAKFTQVVLGKEGKILLLSFLFGIFLVNSLVSSHTPNPSAESDLLSQLGVEQAERMKGYLFSVLLTFEGTWGAACMVAFGFSAIIAALRQAWYTSLVMFSGALLIFALRCFLSLYLGPQCFDGL